MRAVIQRVLSASVEVNKQTTGEINQGLLIYLGVGREDQEQDAHYLAEKVVHLRIFEDEEGKLNRSLQEVKGQALVVSQFTLYGDCRKGRRPSFSSSAGSETGEKMYTQFIEELRQKWDILVETGIFGAYMKVHSVNDGPVTLLIDSTKQF